MLDKSGFLYFENYFDPNKICGEADKVLKNSQKIKWRFVKVYHNIFLYKLINIFAINFPFNKKLNSNLFDEFCKIDLKNIILKNISWNNFEITSVELQHNEKYNYQSTWHRDAEISNLKSIVIILFLRNEKGFRLVPKNIEDDMINNTTFSKEKSYRNGYVNLSKKYYKEFNAKAGDILIFDAGLLHQGYCTGKRTHLLVRSKENTLKNTIDDSLRPDAILDDLAYFSKQHNWNFNQNPYSFIQKIKSILNFLLYYFPIVKIIKYLLDTKKKKLHFHYSILQDYNKDK